jgi:hypothetical protein
VVWVKAKNRNALYLEVSGYDFMVVIPGWVTDRDAGFSMKCVMVFKGVTNIKLCNDCYRQIKRVPNKNRNRAKDNLHFHISIIRIYMLYM